MVAGQDYRLIWDQNLSENPERPNRKKELHTGLETMRREIADPFKENFHGDKGLWILFSVMTVPVANSKTIFEEPNQNEKANVDPSGVRVRDYV